MSAEEERLSKEIEVLIERGYYDEAEEMLGNTTLPNTAELFDRIGAGRAAKPPVVSSGGSQRGKDYVIALGAGIAVALVAALIGGQSRNESMDLLCGLVSFALIVPGMVFGLRGLSRYSRFTRTSRYAAVNEEDQRRSGYERPGYSPRKR